MSTQGLAEFQDRYAALVVAACEWRAMQANPEALADRVFAVLRDHRDAPDLRLTYQVIRRVVFDSYAEYSSRRTLMETLRGVSEPVANAPQDSAEEKWLREALSRLPEREREVLQLAYWDQLAESELAEALGLDAAAVRARIERATARYVSLASRKNPSVEAAAVPTILRSLKPGLRSRWE